MYARSLTWVVNKVKICSSVAVKLMHVSMPLCGVEAGQLFYTRAVIRWLVVGEGGQ